MSRINAKTGLYVLAAAAVAITGALEIMHAQVDGQWWALTGALVGACVKRPGDTSAS